MRFRFHMRLSKMHLELSELDIVETDEYFPQASLSMLSVFVDGLTISLPNKQNTVISNAMPQEFALVMPLFYCFVVRNNLMKKTYLLYKNTCTNNEDYMTVNVVCFFDRKVYINVRRNRVKFR